MFWVVIKKAIHFQKLFCQDLLCGETVGICKVLNDAVAAVHCLRVRTGIEDLTNRLTAFDFMLLSESGVAAECCGWEITDCHTIS